MPLDLTRVKTSTKAILVFLAFNATVPQLEWARDKVIPLLIHHPKLAPVVISIFGALLALHSPMAQSWLHKMYPTAPGKPTDVPATPGTKVDGIEVVTKPE